MSKLFSTITLFGLMATSALYAQSSQPIQADVPFAFTVQKRALPAGTYRFTYDSNTNIVSIQGLSRNRGAAFATASPGAPADGPAKVVFHCYDNGCRLAQFWQGSKLGGKSLSLRQSVRDRNITALTRIVSATSVAK
jgi:hypothetical protein